MFPELVAGDRAVVIDPNSGECKKGKIAGSDESSLGGLGLNLDPMQVDLGSGPMPADREWVQSLWDRKVDDQKNLDPELKRRLLQAGARVGDVTLSLMWDNKRTQNDLDIWVDCDGRGTISFSNKSVRGGLLDIDAQESAPEPVENVFWDMAEKGTYTCTVDNYSGNRKAWLVCLRSKVPINLLNEDGTVQEEGWSGARQVRGVCDGAKSRPFAIKFEVGASRKPKNVSGRPDEVTKAIEAIENLNLVVIDSSKISGWEPNSSKWPVLRSNIDTFVKTAGDNGHLIKADNEAAVRAAFESVAKMMASTGISEDL